MITLCFLLIVVLLIFSGRLILQNYSLRKRLMLMHNLLELASLVITTIQEEHIAEMNQCRQERNQTNTQEEEISKTKQMDLFEMARG